MNSVVNIRANRRWYSGISALHFSILLLVSACVSTARTAPDPSAALGNPGAEGVAVAELPPGMVAYTDTVPGSRVTFDMIPVPGGSIAIDTPDGPETVEIEPFWIRKTEVTWDEFDIYAFLEQEILEDDEGNLIVQPSKPYGAPDRGFGHRGYAALSMSYIVGRMYAAWLSIKTGDTYRLPTEAEWEFACRAGAQEDPGADKETLEAKAWFWDNSFDKTHPVGRLEPNAWGIHDMMGNALEWCTGLDGEPLGCGGHYNSKAENVGCTARLEQTPAWQETDPQIPKSMFWLTDATFIGFRVIRER